MKRSFILLCLLVVYSFSFELRGQPTHTSIEELPQFKLVDSTVFDLPFISYSSPWLVARLKDDTMYLLSADAGTFYILNKQGIALKKMQFKDYLNSEYQFFPDDFYITDNYFAFFDGNVRSMLIDKYFKPCGFYWFKDYQYNYYGGFPYMSFFFSEKNKSFYYTTHYSVDDTSPVASLTQKYYRTSESVGSFSVRLEDARDSSITKSDTNFLQKLEKGDFLIHKPAVYTNKKGFLPYLDFKDIAFDPTRSEIYVSFAPDSIIRVFDPKGNLVRSFGRKGYYIQPKDSLRYIDSAKVRSLTMKQFSYISDSTRYQCAYYTWLTLDDSLNLLCREYLVTDSANIVSGSKVGYRSNALWPNSRIKITHYLQLYDKEKWLGDFKMPNYWEFLGFSGKNLVFYRLENITDSYQYLMHVYYVSFEI